MNTVTIPVTKKVTMEVPNGHIEIIEHSHCCQVKYYNSIYKGSPFLCPTTFSKDYSVEQVMKTLEVVNFLKRFE